MKQQEKIAIIGGGVAGLVAAYSLSQEYEVSLFETTDRLGGHAHTINVQDEMGTISLDTAFLIFNSHTYPLFIKLLKDLNLESQIQDSSMSISFFNRSQNLLYGVNSNWKDLFTQRTNIFRPAFWKLVAEIKRFRKEMQNPKQMSLTLTFNDYLLQENYSQSFIENFALLLGASVWSLPRESIMNFPAHLYIQFFSHHNLMKRKHQARWLSISGGSQQYIDKILQSFSGKVHVQKSPTQIVREQNHVRLVFKDAPDEKFDRVILATPADVSLRLLANASPLEKNLLEVWKYRNCEAVLHTDESIFPRLKTGAWSSWNLEHQGNSFRIHYHLNKILNVNAKKNYFVSLGNLDGFNPAHVLQKSRYRHISFDAQSAALQSKLPQLNSDRTFFCGSYFGFGFHEDAVRSSLAACTALRMTR